MPLDSKLLQETDQHWMRHALSLAERAASENEVPIGAVIVYENNIISEGYNKREKQKRALAHAELEALELANQKLGNWRLEKCGLYVTMEPCVMCAGAIVQARLPRVVFGCRDPKGGAVRSLFEVLSDQRLNHRCEVVEGVLRDECSSVVTDFFKRLRERGQK